MADAMGAVGLRPTVSATPSRTSRPQSAESQLSTNVESAAAADADSSSTDRVTLSEDALDAASPNLFGALRRMLASSGSGGAAGGPNAADGAGLLSGLLGSGFGGNESLSRLFDSVQTMFDELSDGDSELAQKLDMLLETLEKLNARLKNDDGFVAGFERALRQLVATRRALAALGESVQGASVPGLPSSVSAASAAPGGGSTSVSAFAFTLDLEITQSTSIEATVAELTDQGFNVQQVRLESTRTFRLRIEMAGVRMSSEPPRQSEPLILDLDGDGVNPTGYEDGVVFDIDGDGAADRTAFVREGDGALALDRDGNGAIDSGLELFGDQHGAVNGFEELAKFDDNGDGAIDRRDAVWSSLGVIRDANADGRLDPGEFMSLEAAGVESISLVNELLREDDGLGNTLAERGSFEKSDGTTGAAVDVWFGYRPGAGFSGVA